MPLPAPPPAIDAVALTKRFGRTAAVDGADLRVQRRRIFDVGEGTCQEVEGVSMAR